MVAMAKVSGRSSRARFAAYVERLTEVIGHADRAGPLRDYCTGLLMPAERKSVERGFHPHATLCIAAYGFLIAERARLPPSGGGGAGRFEAPRLSEGYSP